MLGRGFRSVALGVAYATCSGLGTVAVAFAGTIMEEEVTWARVAAIVAVLGSIEIAPRLRHSEGAPGLPRYDEL
ncbi:SMR family transporter [Arthrobacter nitrophenolicus]|uniref:SMR family transporter n=2 Tax=Arthrobacter TaxID=1663 RepID=UPI00339AE748